MLSINNLSFKYKKNHDILKDITLTFYDKKMNMILGKNGVGKSTLLKCILENHLKYDGEILVDNKNIKTLKAKEKAKYFSYVYQKVDSIHMLVYDILLLARLPYNELSFKQEDRDKVDKIITELSLNELASKYFDELSSGEKQKVMIAKAIVQESKYLILDEPLANLDLDNQIYILEFLIDLIKRNEITIIMTIHDILLAYRYAYSLYFIKDSKLIYNDLKDNLTEEILSSIYNTPIKIIKENNQKYLKF